MVVKFLCLLITRRQRRPFFKGTLSSILLFNLVLRLRKLLGSGSAMFVTLSPCCGHSDDWPRFRWIVQRKPNRRGYAWKNYDKLRSAKRHRFRPKCRLGVIVSVVGWSGPGSTITKRLVWARSRDWRIPQLSRERSSSLF